MSNKITCRWHQLSYRPYKPSWIRRQIFLLCGESRNNLVVPEEMSLRDPIAKAPHKLPYEVNTRAQLDYTDKDGFIATEYVIAYCDVDLVIHLTFHKPIVEPMASKDVYLKVI